MSEAEPTGSMATGSEGTLELTPLRGAADGVWTARLDAGILQLEDPRGVSVLMLPQEEAARYVRFSYDVMRGRIVTIAIAEGLKRHAFRCTSDQLSRLLDWLPHKSPSQVARDIRASAVGIALFGVLHLVLPGSLFWAWGMCLLAAGALGLVYPKRRMHLVNGALMLMAGLWGLIPWLPAGGGTHAAAAAFPLIPVIVGSALILWGIQQIAMLAPNSQLRVARAIRDREKAVLPKRSQVVRWVGLCNLAVAALSAIYTVAMLINLRLAAQVSSGQPASGSMGPVLPDLVVFAVLTVLAALCAAGFLLRERTTYTEVKVSAQLLLAVLLMAIWGAVLEFRLSAPLHFLGGIFSDYLAKFSLPYVWVFLIAAVVVLNRLFTRAVDRELEQERDETR